MSEVQVKETKEVLAAIRLLAVGILQIKKDGISFADAPQIVDVVRKYQVVIDGLKDAKLAVEEIKDLDSVEAAELFAQVMGLVNDVKKALKGEEVVL